jgi:hypothetical protein
MTLPASSNSSAAVLEQVVIHGDLSRLQPADRVMYYKQVCESIGLNPLTKPFEYIVLNNKLRLYALRDATDQLRKLNGVSITIKSRELVEGCYVVMAQATDKSGRYDESMGSVPIEGLKGEARSNAMMKCETKAKRRVTLSICGLGWLDETEIDSIQGAQSGPQVLSEPILPTSGTLAAQPAAKQEIIIETAEAIKKAFTEDRVNDAYAYYDGSGFDTDEKVALWSLLDSKIRSTLKRMNEAAHVSGKGTISAAQKKRLEARIKEHGIDRENFKQYCKAQFGKEHFSELTPEEYENLDATIEEMSQEPV